MKTKTNLKKKLLISWCIILLGALIALVGAAATQDGRINLLLCLGGLIVLSGIIYHLAMIRCPHCGRSLAGYRPLPKSCPNCHKELDD